MTHSREVRLRGEGEEAPGRRRHFAALQIDVVGRRACRARVLADAVHRVVVVDGKDAGVLRAEGITLRHELDRRGRVRREDDVVRGAVGVEELQNDVAHALDRLRARARRRRLRVRIAEDAAGQQGLLRADLRGAVQRAAGVVGVGVALLVEPREFAPAQLGERQHPRRRRGAK